MKNFLTNIYKKIRLCNTYLIILLGLLALIAFVLCLKYLKPNEKNSNESITKISDEATKIRDEATPISNEASTPPSTTTVTSTNDFITGADLSSYIAVRDSGVVFKDEKGRALDDEGFFERLYKGGTNWVRIRVWNDPYDANGNGYGGGNNDIDKAIIIGKYATQAKMRVLIDFHYSDFWSDPSKYQAPKAWKDMDIEEKSQAVYEYTKDSLDKLVSAGVDVGMVQIGNESNNGICGETDWDNMASIFAKGSQGVRDFDKNILVAIHFADPQKGLNQYAQKLENYNIDYDVFASSYYPFWHGSLENLGKELSEIADKYNKKAMVAETSWAYTTKDGDGHPNSAPGSTSSLAYEVSVKGQIDEIRNVVETVKQINNGIGVFYWEPAWICANNVYQNGGNADKTLLEKNKSDWEQYGSGWASSYAAEYDPKDAGAWYGGSAVDNQAWFDFDGNALESIDAFTLQ